MADLEAYALTSVPMVRAADLDQGKIVDPTDPDDCATFDWAIFRDLHCDGGEPREMSPDVGDCLVSAQFSSSVARE